MKRSFHVHKMFGLACGFTGLTLCASAQMDIFSGSLGGSTSTDTFGGDPDSYGLIKIPSDTDDWTRHFRIGAMVGMNISASFSEKGTFNIPAGNLNNGIYDDGYVRVDQTGNSGGLTSYWGYNNSSQYNAAQQTLTMHSVTSYTPTAGSNSTKDGGAFPGFEMAYGDNLWYWKHARVGWELGFGLLPIKITDTHPMAASINQSSYTFDASGFVMPGAPYKGGSSGQGPVISGTPESTSSQSIGDQVITGKRTLDAMLFTIRLGPSLYWDLSDNFGMSLGAGPAIGIATETLHYNEIISTPNGTSQDKGSISGTDVVFGGYVNGTLLYHLLDNADIYLSAEYMPLGNASISGGDKMAQRQAELKLGGQIYVSLGVNWPF
jgi:hypothetical protein